MIRFIAAGLALSITGTSWAQDAASTLSRVASEQSASPSTVQPLGVRQGLEIVAGSDKEEATISIGKKLGRSVYNLSLTTPVDKEKKQGTFANLDGLSDALRGKLTYVGQVSDPRKWNTHRDLGAAQSACEAAATARGFSPAELKAKLADGSLNCDDLSSPGADADSLYRNPTSPDGKRAISRTLEPIRKRYLKSSWGGQWVQTVRASLNVGTEEFSFLDPVTFAKSEGDETEWSASLGFASVNILERMSIGVGYRRESVYEPSKKTTLCTATGVANQLECETANLGGPVRKEKDLATLQFDVLRWNWAMTSLVTYDFEADKYGIEVPFYLLRDEKAAWTGGVSIGWTSDERDVTVQIFVGVPFSLFD
jgi:hypothetical protein